MTEQTLKPVDDLLGWPSSEPSEAPAQPRLLVLHHADLSRIGAMTAPEVLNSGAWVTVGRLAPELVAPTPSVRSGPLSDPYISRSQLRVRWLAEEGCFEVEPVGQRRLTLVELAPEQPEPKLTPIVSATRLAPGALLAIGNRALIGLDLAPWHPPSDGRMEMVGETEALWELRGEIGRVAELERPVLVLGPTGAGKEMVARALHAQSARRSRTFLPVNCAALPEHLAESLLFGHERGAFTGASAQRSGFFREASDGTLFLDELGELPLTIQAKLLRVIQDRQVYAVGASHPSPVGTWLVAATNRDPEAEMHRGTLRPDFYYRIATLPVHVPTLEARRWDVPLLFVHFLSARREHHPQLGRLWRMDSARGPAVPLVFMIDLMRRAWPGNIRELHNVVEQTVRQNLHEGSFSPPRRSPWIDGMALSQEDASGASASHDSPSSDDADSHDADAPAAAAPSLPIDADAQNAIARTLSVSRKLLVRLLPPEMTFDPAWSEDERTERVRLALREALVDVLLAHELNQTQVAKDLGVARTTVIRLMQRFELPRPQDITPEAIEAAKREVGPSITALARALDVPERLLAAYLDVQS